MTARSTAARDCHPEDGTAYVVTSSGREYGREYILTDAHGVARSRSRLGATCTVEHEQADGTWVTVATYRYGTEVHGQGVM